jgi:hypothetical protein
LIGTGLTSAASPRVHISSTCKVGQKLRVCLPLLTCSPSVWPSRLLYRTDRKSRRDLWITLYLHNKNQQDAPFYTQFISIINLYMFRGGLLLNIRRYFSV